MHYESGLGSYTNDYLENILDTEYRYDVPYQVDKEKYFSVMEKYNKDTRIPDGDVLLFKTDYSKHEEESDPYSYAFFAWPENSPECSKDFYDCAIFDEKYEYESFIRNILTCIISPSIEYLGKRKNNLLLDKVEIDKRIAIIDDIINKTK